MARKPWLQFYPSDYRGDPKLRACSLAARALWVEMFCIMHEAEPYGHLVIAGQPVDDAALAKQVGERAKKVIVLRTELELRGVFSRTDNGTIYSRKMVKMEQTKNARAAGGKLSIRHPNVPAPKDTHQGPPSASRKDTLKDPPQIPDTIFHIPKTDVKEGASAPGADGPLGPAVRKVMAGLRVVPSNG